MFERIYSCTLVLIAGLIIGFICGDAINPNLISNLSPITHGINCFCGKKRTKKIIYDKCNNCNY